MLQARNLLKKGPTQVSSCEFLEIFKNTCINSTPLVIENTITLIDFHAVWHYQGQRKYVL